MVYEEIVPYLNKFVQVNLKNKKRKLGWLVVDFYHEVSEEPLKEVHCVNVRFGESYAKPNNISDIKALKEKAETFQIDDILKIRASL